MTRNHHPLGMNLVEVVVVLAILGVLLALVLPAVQKIRDAASRASCASNLRQLGLALHQYHQVYASFPPGISHIFADGLPVEQFQLMRWHGRVLPFIEQQGIWQQMLAAYAQDPIFLNDPPHTDRSLPVALFLCPADGRRFVPGVPPGESPANTSYVGVAGVSYLRQDGILYVDSRVRLADVTDGASNTLLADERPADVYVMYGIWYPTPGDWLTAQSTLGVREVGVMDWIPGCPYGPYEFGPGSLRDRCSSFHYWSLHSGGANFAFADGAVRFLAYSAAPLLPALASRSGGEVPDFPD
jgi:prepilin-type N-terminal cleavage/methylation domain-containing protein/prepilin-type processing-associated H-X9-DG protein